ncbi:MAG TPA: TAXI family TRAP transporter solute-binding subunit [Candidatus Cybelea sp.]|nr:TAXI family TRAP transporter solute-binding subunit [Candidatus Cybelea sp.]
MAAAQTRPGDARTEAPNNKGVVEIITGTSSGISVRIAEDLASVVDDGATRRVLPVVGRGAIQNITDLRLLHGIDMAILQLDVVDAYKQSAREGSLTYIAKLYNEEFHLLARRDIKTVADLANQKVNVDRASGGSATTAGRIFGLLKIPAVWTNDDQEVAIEKLRKGEIAAIAYVTGKPAPLFRGVKSAEGLHFLAIPLRSDITGAYVPTRLTAADYPDIIASDQPVDTVAVGAVLAVANLNPLSDRYHYVANFVDVFFTKFDSLLEPGHHPKWREVNLTAELPGWRRFGPADVWLKRNANVASESNPQEIRAIFSRYIEERRKATGGADMTQQQKDELFKQFQRWQAEQRR